MVISALGGGRPDASLAGLDSDMTHHWRALPLFYARATDAQLTFFEDLTQPNKIKRILKTYEPFRRMIYQRRGARVRALFDQNDLPAKEQSIRARIKRNRLWMR